ncbi:DUF167 domain-containing protein [Hydrogenobaculum acidophilum]
MILRVKVKPNSKNVSVERIEDGFLKVCLKSPPIDGKANDELVDVLSDFLDIPKSKIFIKTGKTSKEKLIEINV